MEDLQEQSLMSRIKNGIYNQNKQNIPLKSCHLPFSQQSCHGSVIIKVAISDSTKQLARIRLLSGRRRTPCSLLSSLQCFCLHAKVAKIFKSLVSNDNSSVQVTMASLIASRTKGHSSGRPVK